MIASLKNLKTGSITKNHLLKNVKEKNVEEQLSRNYRQNVIQNVF